MSKKFLFTIYLLTRSPCQFGPFFLPPKELLDITNRRLYWARRAARPVFFFFFSSASTFGVWPLTLPARAKEPWTLPPKSLPISWTLSSETPPKRTCSVDMILMFLLFFNFCKFDLRL